MNWLIAFAYTIFLFFSFKKSSDFWKRFSQGSFSSRLAIAIAVPMTLNTVVLILYKIANSIYYDHSWERLQTAFALAHGYPIYHNLNSGAILNTLYGPVSVFAYLPATVTDKPTYAMWIATTLTAAYFYLPALILFAVEAGRGKQRFGHDPELLKEFRVWVWLAFLCFAFGPFLCSPLRVAAFNIHADAPALGFASAACTLVYFYSRRKNRAVLILSAFFAALAVWSKQVILPLLPAMALYLWVSENFKTAFYYSMAVFIVAAALGWIFVKKFGAEPLLLNMITIPASHPWRENEPLNSSIKLLRENLIFIGMGIASLVPLLKAWSGSFREWTLKNHWPLYFIAAVFLIPASLLGNIKIGGSNNTLSYTCYFLLLAVVLSYVEPFPGPQRRGWLALTAGIFLLIQIPSVYFRIFTSDGTQNYAETAYRYIKKHPGRAYFPCLGVMNVMAEDKVYHASVAIIDRSWAGLPIRKDHFRAHLPAQMEYLVFREGTEDDKQWLDIPELWFIGTDPELPGFRVYKNHRE